MFPHAPTRDCKQHFETINYSRIALGVYQKGDSNANSRASIFDVSHDKVNKFVSERKQCFSSRCHISDIDIVKLSFKSPSLDKLSPATPSQCPIMH